MSCDVSIILPLPSIFPYSSISIILLVFLSLLHPLMFMALLFLFSYLFLYSFTIDSFLSPDFIFVSVNYACIDPDVIECLRWIGSTSLDFELRGSSYSNRILCVFGVTL